MKHVRTITLLLLFGLGNLYAQETALKASMERGSEIYNDFCVACHMPTGEGIPFVFPPLANSDYLMQQRTASIKGVKFGQEGELVVNGETYNNTMASMGLEDGEIADVMNYILNSWGNSSNEMVTVEEVEAVTKD
ncbi:c-type cytochrome [Maribacter polysaccharolyticus]|uniref:c-type cytochrome n=1 Tax=Maribacter polysaccharolyticus TaxID=3020831 RepID=UPI00237FC5C2|nr:cytochrome c [Maribacter polysaccharolyticus]MDE3743554.1 cytochrome c [Maribacter polysaccharolyticus]